MKPTRYTPELIDEYRRKGYWETTTFYEIWDRNAEQYPGKEAVVDSRTRLTWAEAKLYIDRIALGLMELGIARDRVLVVQLPNCVEQVLISIACEKAGIVNLSILRTMRHKEMEYILAYTEAPGVIIPWRFRDFDYYNMIQGLHPQLPHLEHILVVGDQVPDGATSITEMMQQPLENRYPLTLLQERAFEATEVARIRHSTGTTGFPKLVEETICDRVHVAKELIRCFGITSEDVFGVFTPLTGGGGSPAFLCSPVARAKIVLMEHFDAEEAFKLIERERITIVGIVPTMLVMMLEHPSLGQYDLSSLRVFIVGGSPLPPKLARDVEERIGCLVVNRYGTADGGPISTAAIGDPIDIRHLTVGQPYTGNEVKLVDETGKELPWGEVGEIIFRGPTSHPGLFRNPEGTWELWDEDGWYPTGDLGKLDEQGNLMIVGRRKDVIIRGGQNIYPAEIESILMTHPQIVDVAIVGMPDPVMGEKACAYVVPKPGEQLTLEEITVYLKDKSIAAYKLPQRLEILDKIPLVADQKPDKKTLRQDIAAKLKAEGTT